MPTLTIPVTLTAEIPEPPPGADGLSAFEIAVQNGFVGTEADWLLSLKGDAGIQGEQGLQGIQGIPGSGGIGASVPGGRLTLVSGAPEMPQTADYSSTALYYAPFESDKIPLFDGTNWGSYDFTSGPFDTVGLSMTGGAAWAANTKRDVFVTLVDGIPALCTGPAWPDDTLASRGLVRRNGLWVNSASMTCDVGIVVAANQATWVGSINIGATAGTLTALFTQGQNRRCDVWSVYHQKEIVLRVGHPCLTTTDITRWIPNTQYPAWKAFNNNLDNKGCAFTGLPTNRNVRYVQRSFLNSVPPSGLCAAINVICKDSIATGSQRGTWGSSNTDAYGVLDGVSEEAVFDDCSEVGEHWYYMGTGNANAMSTTTMLGMPNPAHPNMAGRNTEDAHCLTIKYLG